MSSGRRAVVGALAVALLVLTTGCGSDGAPKETGAAATSSLTFTSPAVGGGTVESASFAGRPALLWFWAPW